LEFFLLDSMGDYDDPSMKYVPFFRIIETNGVHFIHFGEKRKVTWRVIPQACMDERLLQLNVDIEKATGRRNIM